MDIYEEILEARRQNRIYAVASVVKTEGSTSRSAGAKMLVLANGEISGSVGGGSAERQVVQDCQMAMETGEPLLKEYSTITMDGLSCSGSITVFIEPGKQLPYLYLCGCGHVAQAVLPLAKSLGYYVVCVDARDISPFRDALNGADELHILKHFRELAGMDLVSGASYVVCSYSHQTDGEILEVILNREPGYVGMLGGKPKIKALFGRLKKLGYGEALLRQVHAPIGLDLGGETPEEVALSIMAQVQAARYGRSGEPMSRLLRDAVFPL